MSISVKRVYDPPQKRDGLRVLIDRLWPRGLSKDKANIERWAKDIAPSDELRKWFGHDPRRWDEFQRRYREELKANRQAVDELIDWIDGRETTLLYAAKDTTHNHARVLADHLARRRA
jgi:uncharacterized protein YeaO (DUF488 family)